MNNSFQHVFMWLHQEGTQVGSTLILANRCKFTLNKNLKLVRNTGRLYFLMRKYTSVPYIGGISVRYKYKCVVQVK